MTLYIPSRQFTLSSCFQKKKTRNMFEAIKILYQIHVTMICLNVTSRDHVTTIGWTNGHKQP